MDRILTLGFVLCFALATYWEPGWYDWLESAALFHISICDFCGSVVVCAAYRARVRGQRIPWFRTLIDCTVGQFGGTTLVGLLLGQPPSWTLSHNAPRALLLAWWLQLGDSLVFRAGAALSTGHAISSWGADKAINHARAGNAVFATLIAGALAASGGGLIQTTQYNGFKKAAVGSVLYYILRDPHDVLGHHLCTPRVARLIIGLYSLTATLLPVFSVPPPHDLVEIAVRLVLRVPAYHYEPIKDS